ncbi:fungal-specific transcription factor domain-containing protein [Podospora didyma]|uniref:Fungal-specific transcription factor domain-containing protein n=1 Tax=Podospora didyma TaxID=330526 RepID=A0AAE0U3P9_9PEZI|nr:fungal-specific transcription factor domain-containing protein [Podospora didyma]
MPRGSSFSDNPLLRVSRPVSACSRCRGAKVKVIHLSPPPFLPPYVSLTPEKCDGKLPACTACEKAGRESECSAANDQFARGKERSYVAALELRVEKLERRLAYARSRKASVAMHDSDSAPSVDPSRKDSLAVIRAAIHRKAARKRENSDVNALVSDFGYLSVNATTRDFEPSVTNMTFARLVLAASTNSPLPEPKTTELPPKQEAYDIVRFYLANIYPFYPAFHESHLLHLLDEVYQEGTRQTRSSDHWLLFMVLAIGSTAQSRSMEDKHYSDGLEFVARALPHADRALMPGYVTQLQALLLLTQYSMLDPAHFDSWHLIGFTCRAVVDLGYHQDPPDTQTSDKTTLEARRRTFYCVYALDRAISMVHARAFSFTDDAVSVGNDVVEEASTIARRTRPLPNGSAPAYAPTSTDPSIYLSRLRRLQSAWYQILFQCDPTDPLPNSSSFIWDNCLKMRKWSDELPIGLPVAIREMLDLELRYSYVYCIAPCSRAPHITNYDRVLIFEHAIAYVDRIYEVAHAPTNGAFYTYHDALRAYFMGSQFVAVLHDAADTLLSGTIVSPPPTAPGDVPPPSLPDRFDRATSGDNLDRSLRTLERVGLTLKKYGERWEIIQALMGTFEMISAKVMEDLHARRRLREEQQNMQQALPTSQQPISHPQQRTPLPQQQMAPPPQEVRWVDVDVAQMIKGNGQI